MTNIRNLVFAGAGVDGTAYVGALKQLESEIGSLQQIQKVVSVSSVKSPLQQIERVAGASCGSLMGLLVALNCTADEIETLYNKIDFTKIADKKNFITQGISLLEHYSIYDNKELQAVIDNILREKVGRTDLTFGELKQLGFKDLHVVTTIVGLVDGDYTTIPHFFSASNAAATQIRTVIVPSCTIPGVFPPVYLKEIEKGKWVEDKEGVIHVDGGWTLNLPEQIFDKKKYLTSESTEDANCHLYNEETLGFVVYSDQQVKNMQTHQVTIQPLPRTNNPLSYLIALFNGAVLGKQTYLFNHSRDPERTVLIPNGGISVIDFALNDAKKVQLKNAGKEAVKLHFHKDPTLTDATNITRNANMFFAPTSPANTPEFKPSSPSSKNMKI